ncbi:MAG: hypothetical protein RSC97_10530 [Eubacterium sp.]
MVLSTARHSWGKASDHGNKWSREASSLKEVLVTAQKDSLNTGACFPARDC